MKFNYKEYFKDITPKNKMDIYNRFIFAFCSVHTTWESNIRGYNMLKDNTSTDLRTIKPIIKRAGLGLNNVRSKAIKLFTKAFNEDYKQFTKRRAESWQDYALRLEKNIYGLGHAKTRFAIELLYPVSAKVCCVDTHVIQWAKQNPNKMSRALYNKIEQGWLNHSKQKGLNPVEARWKWWDNKQGYEHPRYWSHVLETQELKTKYGELNERR